MPRIRKLSAASPQYCFSHSMLASNPPAAATRRAWRGLSTHLDRLPQASADRKHAVVDAQDRQLRRRSTNLDAEPLGVAESAFSHRPAAAEEERVVFDPGSSSPPRERPPVDALVETHPSPECPSTSLIMSVRQKYVAQVSRSRVEGSPEFLLGIGSGEDVGRCIWASAYCGYGGCCCPDRISAPLLAPVRRRGPPRADRCA